MKFAVVLLLSLLASCDSFVPKFGSRRQVATELFNFRPTKWTPKGGSSASFSGPAAPSPIATPAAPSAANLAQEWAASNNAPFTSASVPVAADAASGGPKKSFSPTRWSPQTGSRPMAQGTPGSWTSSTAESSPVSSISSMDATVTAASPVAAAAATITQVQDIGPKTSYSGTRWSPQTGSRPMTQDASGQWTPCAGASLSAAAPQGVHPQVTTPETVDPWLQYSMPAVGSAPQAAVPVQYAVSDVGGGSKTSYSGIRWSPETGSRPMTQDASGKWTPSAGSGVSFMAPQVMTPQPAAVPQATVSALSGVPQVAAPAQYNSVPALGSGPKTSYSGTRWSPQTGSRPMTQDASGKWTTSAGASLSSAAAEDYTTAPLPAFVVPQTAAAEVTTSQAAPQLAAIPQAPPQVAATPQVAVAPQVPPTQAVGQVQYSAPAVGGGPKNSYSGSRWSPKTGSRPMSQSGPNASNSGTLWSPKAASQTPLASAAPDTYTTAPAAASPPAPQEAAPEMGVAPPAAASVQGSAPSSVGPKTSYSGSRWSPKTGSRPVAQSVPTFSFSSRAPVASAAPETYTTAPATSAPQDSAPQLEVAPQVTTSVQDSAPVTQSVPTLSFSSRTSAAPETYTTAPVTSAPQDAAPQLEVAPQVTASVQDSDPVTQSVPTLSFSSRTPVASTAPETFTAAPETSAPQDAAPQPQVKAPVPDSVPAPVGAPKTSYSGSRWSPQAASRPAAQSVRKLSFSGNLWSPKVGSQAPSASVTSAAAPEPHNIPPQAEASQDTPPQAEAPQDTPPQAEAPQDTPPQAEAEPVAPPAAAPVQDSAPSKTANLWTPKRAEPSSGYKAPFKTTRRRVF